MSAYAETVELRHSLTHRRAYVDAATNGLILRDESGRALRPLSASEQEALALSVLRASELVLSDPADGRSLTALGFELARLGAPRGRPPQADRSRRKNRNSYGGHGRCRLRPDQPAALHCGPGGDQGSSGAHFLVSCGSHRAATCTHTSRQTLMTLA